MRVALITGAEMAKPDPESHLLIHELGILGISSELISLARISGLVFV